MNERQNSPDCERAQDLMAFLYDEASQDEARDFQLHLQDCSRCRDEVASLGTVRSSITAWRDEALSAFVSNPVVTKPRTKSALAAWRQFFDLSPLWLKGATALAAVTFCVLAGLVITKTGTDHVSEPKVNQGAMYTEQDVNRIVKEALAKQEKTIQPEVVTASNPVVAVKPSKPKSVRTSPSSELAKSRRPLSRAEREQLASELRLLSTPNDAALNLLGDRINQ
jgi:anti-sigma factor RsiW